ncbi:MAG: cation:proton antiporter [Thaumarchaeota archaeon]|nr:cation:proton antiporter [Nitrososphaerota archaeon]
METEVVFFSIGIITIIGYIASNIFDRTGIPDTPFLIILGFIAAAFIARTASTAPDQESLSLTLVQIAPYLSTLAIAVILFNGGMYLKIRQVIEETPRGFFVTSTSVIITIFVLTVVGYLINSFVFDNPWGTGRDALFASLFFGAALCGTSSAVIIPLVNKLNLNKKAETFLTIESAFTDVFVVVLSVTILSIYTGTSNPESSDGVSSILLQGIAGKFSIGIVFGILGGLIWLKILQSFPIRVSRIASQQDVTHDDILTLTTCLMLYGFSEMSGGNGALAALCFGLVLGNGKEFGFIPSFRDNPVDAGSLMRKFQGQISFLLTTFFFVYLGMIFEPATKIILLGVFITGLLVVARNLSFRITLKKDKSMMKILPLLSSLLPRGLAAAAVSQLPSTLGYEWPYMQQLVISVIIFSVVAAAIGSYVYGRSEEVETQPITPNS